MSVADLASRLTRRSRSNFYYAFLTLPRPRREALYAVYAFCRIVDDIADLGVDGAADPAAQHAALATWRDEVARCYDGSGEPRHPIARQLASAVNAYKIPREALEAIIDGVAMDVDGAVFALRRQQASRAREYYRRADAAFPHVDARSLVAARIMGAIYAALLEEIETKGFRVFGERITVPTRRKVAIAVRCWAGARL